MDALVRKDYLNKEDVFKLGFSEGCTLGKSYKLSFPKVKNTTKGVLEYIHSDLWGSPSITPKLVRK